MPAVRVVISSALTICFDFVSRDDTFYESAFLKGSGYGTTRGSYFKT